MIKGLPTQARHSFRSYPLLVLSSLLWPGGQAYPIAFMMLARRGVLAAAARGWPAVGGPLGAPRALTGSATASGAQALPLDAGSSRDATDATVHRNYWSLLDMGLSESDAQQLWHKAPHVFQELPLDAPALRAKLQWCREMMGLSVRDVVLHHRGFLTEGLRGLEQRVSFMERAGASSRAAGVNSSKPLGPSWMLISSTPQFCASLGRGVHEFEAHTGALRKE